MHESSSKSEHLNINRRFLPEKSQSTAPLMNVSQSKVSQGQVLVLKAFVSRLSFCDPDDNAGSCGVITRGNNRAQPLFSDLLFSDDEAQSSCCILPSFRLCGPTVNRNSNENFFRMSMNVVSTKASTVHPRLFPSSKVVIPSMAASLFDTNLGSMKSCSLQFPSNESEAALNLSSNSLWTALSIEEAPKTMKDSISTSFSSLVRSHVRKRNLGCIKKLSIGNGRSSMLNSNKPYPPNAVISSVTSPSQVIITSCVTSFETTKASDMKINVSFRNDGMKQQELVLSLPLLFQCHISMTTNGSTNIVKFLSATGTINGTFTNGDSSLRKVEVKIDMESLYKCMNEQAHIVTLDDFNQSIQPDLVTRSISKVSLTDSAQLNNEISKNRPNQSLSSMKLLLNENKQSRRIISSAMTLSRRQLSSVRRQASSSKSQMRSSVSFGKPVAHAFESSSNVTFNCVNEKSEHGSIGDARPNKYKDPFGFQGKGLSGSGLFQSFLSTDKLSIDNRKVDEKPVYSACNQVFIPTTGAMIRPANPLVDAINGKHDQHKSLASMKLLLIDEEKSRKKTTNALSLRKSPSMQVKSQVESSRSQLRSCTSFGKPGASAFKSVGNETFEASNNNHNTTIRQPNITNGFASMSHDRFNISTGASESLMRNLVNQQNERKKNKRNDHDDENQSRKKLRLLHSFEKKNSFQPGDRAHIMSLMDCKIVSHVIAAGPFVGKIKIEYEDGTTRHVSPHQLIEAA